MTPKIHPRNWQLHAWPRHRISRESVWRRRHDDGINQRRQSSVLSSNQAWHKITGVQGPSTGLQSPIEIPNVQDCQKYCIKSCQLRQKYGVLSPHISVYKWRPNSIWGVHSIKDEYLQKECKSPLWVTLVNAPTSAQTVKWRQNSTFWIGYT